MTTSIAKTQRHPISRTVPARQFSDLYHSPPNKGISRRGLRYTNTSRSVTSYSHSLGGLGIAIAYTQQTRTQQKEHSIEGQDIFRVRDYVLELSSTILGYYFRLCFRYIYGSISHSLQVDPVSNIADPIFYLCLDGEVSAVQSMLAEKSVSPFVRDHSGATLLHVSFFSSHSLRTRTKRLQHAAAGGSSEMMKLLLQCGIDGSKTDHFFNQ
jgi:hypothetical protein